MEADAPSSDVPDEQQPKIEETVVSPPQTISITDGFAPMNQGPILTGTAQMPSGQLVYLQPPSGAAKVIGIFVIIWGVLFGVLSNGINMLGSLSIGNATLIALDAVNILLGVAIVVGGVMLALGRAMGETMAVTMIIGNSNNFSISLLAPGNTIAAMLANQFGEADGSQVSSLMYAAFVLIIMTLAVNIFAQWIVKRLSLKY